MIYVGLFFCIRFVKLMLEVLNRVTIFVRVSICFTRLLRLTTRDLSSCPHLLASSLSPCSPVNTSPSNFHRRPLPTFIHADSAEHPILCALMIYFRKSVNLRQHYFFEQVSTFGYRISKGLNEHSRRTTCSGEEARPGLPPTSTLL